MQERKRGGDRDVACGWRYESSQLLFLSLHRTKEKDSESILAHATKYTVCLSLYEVSLLQLAHRVVKITDKCCCQ